MHTHSPDGREQRALELALKLARDRDKKMETLEAAWPKFEGPEHAALGILPSYMSVSSTDASVWHNVATAPASYTDRMAQTKTEGAQFVSAYEKDVQFGLARRNHHVHLQTKKGRVPLSVCRPNEKQKDARV